MGTHAVSCGLCSEKSSASQYRRDHGVSVNCGRDGFSVICPSRDRRKTNNLRVFKKASIFLHPSPLYGMCSISTSLHLSFQYSAPGGDRSDAAFPRCGGDSRRPRCHGRLFLRCAGAHEFEKLSFIKGPVSVFLFSEVIENFPASAQDRVRG